MTDTFSLPLTAVLPWPEEIARPEYVVPVFIDESRRFLGLHWNSLYAIGYAAAGNVGNEKSVYTRIQDYKVDAGVGFEASLSWRSYLAQVKRLEAAIQSDDPAEARRIEDRLRRFLQTDVAPPRDQAVDRGGQHLLVGDPRVDGVGPGEGDAVATDHGDAASAGVHGPHPCPRGPAREGYEGHLTKCGL